MAQIQEHVRCGKRKLPASCPTAYFKRQIMGKGPTHLWNIDVIDSCLPSRLAEREQCEEHMIKDLLELQSAFLNPAISGRDFIDIIMRVYNRMALRDLDFDNGHPTEIEKVVDRRAKAYEAAEGTEILKTIIMQHEHTFSRTKEKKVARKAKGMLMECLYKAISMDTTDQIGEKVAKDLAEDEQFLVTLFQYLRHTETYGSAMKLIQDVLQYRTSVFLLDTVGADFFSKLVATFSVTKLGNFCNTLALLVSDLDIIDTRNPLAEINAKERAAGFVNPRDINQQVVLDVPGLLEKMVKFAVSTNHAPRYRGLNTEVDNWMRMIDDTNSDVLSSVDDMQLLEEQSMWVGGDSDSEEEIPSIVSEDDPESFSSATTPDEHILHLNVGIYSLTLRLYGLFPMHFLCAIRTNLATGKITQQLYTHSIEPMVRRMKLHPSLTTTSKEFERNAGYWKNKELPDIIAECASLSLDTIETTKDYSISCPIKLSPAHETTAPKPSISSTIASTKPWQPPVSTATAGPSAISNSDDFFSPAERLGLITPPAGDPPTPGFLSSTQFDFGSMRLNSANRETSTTPRGRVLAQTPQATETPAPTPLADSSSLNRSRNASGATKASLSRLSLDEAVPSSPMRKEFTSVPPLDVPRVRTTSKTAEHGSSGSHELSVANLPGLLEKISDDQSTQDDPSSNSEDDEVSNINRLQDHPTPASVNKLVTSLNRIRFNSMTVHENQSEPESSERPRSCPILVVSPDTSGEKERPASSQTGSSISGTRISDRERDNVTLLSELGPVTGSGDSTVAVKNTSIQPTLRTVIQHDFPKGDSSNDPHLIPGAAAALDHHFQMLDRYVHLSEHLYNELQADAALTSQTNTEWTHFGGKPPESEINILRSQLLLLHTQIVYERQKREMHAQRNRRLLRRVTRAGKLEEENSSMAAKLRVAQEDIFNLTTTIRLQNSESHSQQGEHRRADRMKEAQLGDLISENERLKYENDELKSRLETQVEAFRLKCHELAECQGKLESLQQDYESVEKDAFVNARYKDEVTNMKKKLVQMGEQEMQLAAQLKQLNFSTGAELSNSQEQAFLEKIESLNRQLKLEADRTAQRQLIVQDLETRYKHKDQTIDGLLKEIEYLKGEMREKCQAMEERNKNGQSIQIALEERILALYNQIGLLNNQQRQINIRAAHQEIKASLTQP